MKLRKVRAVQTAAAAPTVVQVPGPSPIGLLKSGAIGEALQKIVYDSLLIDPPGGGTSLVRQQFELFTHYRSQNPELTNLVEPQRMGPNESFVIEGIELQANAGCTQAAFEKFCQDARIRIGIGPDDVERLSYPLVFLPSANGGVGSGVAQSHKGLYRLGRGQEITLQQGHPFSVRIYQGPNAGTLADAEVVDVFVKLLGTYNQGLVR